MWVAGLPITQDIFAEGDRVVRRAIVHRTGEIDLAFVGCEALPLGVSVRAEIPDKVVLIGSRAHLFARRRIRQEDLRGCDFFFGMLGPTRVPWSHSGFGRRRCNPGPSCRWVDPRSPSAW